VLLRLDHLVVAVLDPEEAAAELERRVGLVCSGGGRHPLWGTYNRLAWFGDTYVELIGVFDRALTGQGAVSRAVMAALDAARVGLVTYAVATDDAAGDRARLRASGAGLGEVEERSRTRPDGQIVRWRASFPAALGAEEPPFLVEHELVGAEWGADVRAARATAVHPIGGQVRVTGLRLPVRRPEATVADYRRELGIAFTGDPPVAIIGEQRVMLRRGDPALDPAEVLLATPVGQPRVIEALGVRWRIATR
jgi:hypothetical protein